MKTFLRILAYCAATLAFLLLLVRFAGSPWVTSQINRKLAALPEYTGYVDSVQLALWRGTVSAHAFRLFSRDHAGDGPVVTVRQASLSIALLPLLRGKVGGHGTVDGIEVVIVAEPARPKDAPEKAKAGPPIRKWQDILRNAFPLEITRFEIQHGRIKFSDPSAQPVAEMLIDDFHLVATDFSNRPKSNEDLPAHLTVTARVGGSGRMTSAIHANAAAEQPRFTANLEVKNLELLPIHDFLVKYALIDVSQGTFEMYTEITAAGGHYDGYLKPFFKDLKFKAVPDPSKNLIQRAATKVASATQNLLKNDKGQIATKAPFKGDFEANKVEVWVTIENLLRNAFVQSLREGLEGQTPAK
ncbi:MAG: hypothetical protein JWQ83_410 [Lacunisphaera sp.]|nr:hypothetical protein [Lacunisphaera sp.]